MCPQTKWTDVMYGTAHFTGVDPGFFDRGGPNMHTVDTTCTPAEWRSATQVSFWTTIIVIYCDPSVVRFYFKTVLIA